MNTNPRDLPRSETLTIDGWIVSRGCVLCPATGRWEPVVSVRHEWAETGHESVTAGAADQQDTPELALDRADLLARQWLKEHAASAPSSPSAPPNS